MPRLARAAAALAVLAAPAGADEVPAIQAVRATAHPRIDGRLDDAVWRLAPATADFLQREPVEGAPPSERTEVRILFDDGHLYFGLRCFDSEADRLVANLMRRDAELEENDNIQIILDPYNDGRGGFFFSTNPLGARLDMLLTDEGRARNQAWDAVWRSGAAVDSLGWSAEVAIPLDQLRYPDSDEAVWGPQHRPRNPQKERGGLPRPPAAGLRVPGPLPHLAPGAADADGPASQPSAHGRRPLPAGRLPARLQRPRFGRVRPRPRPGLQARPHSLHDPGPVLEDRLRPGGSRPGGSQPHPLQPVLPREARLLPRRGRHLRVRREGGEAAPGSPAADAAVLQPAHRHRGGPQRAGGGRGQAHGPVRTLPDRGPAHDHPGRDLRR